MSFFIRKDEEGNVPKDAIPIKRDNVCGFYQVVVDTWKPKSEIWALTFGPSILGVAGALSGVYGSMYFRRKLRLRHYGIFSTYLPNAVLPFLLVQSFHQMIVTKDIFLDPLGCSLCKETRAAAIQVTLGLVQPLILVPVSSFLFATRHYTYRLPSPISHTKDFFRVCKQLYRPLKVPMTINVALQIMIACFITHMEENHFLYLQRAILNPDDRNVVETKAA